MARLDDDQFKLTKTQERLWEVLKDGKPVPIKQLMALVDDQHNLPLLRMHLCNLRTKVRRMPGNLTIVTESGTYRVVQYVDVFREEIKP